MNSPSRSPIQRILPLAAVLLGACAPSVGPPPAASLSIMRTEEPIPSQSYPVEEVGSAALPPRLNLEEPNTPRTSFRLLPPPPADVEDAFRDPRSARFPEEVRDFARERMRRWRDDDMIAPDSQAVIEWVNAFVRATQNPNVSQEAITFLTDEYRRLVEETTRGALTD